MNNQIILCFIAASLLSRISLAQNWVEKTKVFSDTYEYFEGHNFGTDVDVDGDIAVIGAYRSSHLGDHVGIAYVLERTVSGWENIAALSMEDVEANAWFGADVAISGDQIIVGAHGIGTNEGAAYIYEKPAGGWTDMTESAKILHSSPTNARFGSSVSIASDVVTISDIEYSVDGHATAGAVFVFEKMGDAWTQVAELSASDADVGKNFGQEIDMNEDVIVIGNYTGDGLIDDSGAAYVFVKPLTGWDDMKESAKLHATDGAATHRFGGSIAIDNDVIIIGDYYYFESFVQEGAAYIFEKPDLGWTDMGETVKISSPSPEFRGYFGNSVAIKNNYLIVGSSGADSYASDAGNISIYEKTGESWVDHESRGDLQMADPRAGSRLGNSVALTDEYILGGAYTDGELGTNSGATFIYENPVSGWSSITETKKELCPPAILRSNAWQGSSVAIDGDFAVVGARADYNDENINSGSAYVYQRLGQTWQKVAKLNPSFSRSGESIGHSVAISGDVIVVGEYDFFFNEISRVFVFQRPGSGWEDMSETAILTRSEGVSRDQFGISVDILGDYIVVGAARANGLADNSGAAYIYERPVGGWVSMTETAELLSSDGSTDDYFGTDVCLDGSKVLVSSIGGDGGVYIYDMPDGGWQDITETAKLSKSDAGNNNNFGYRAVLDGGTIAVSARLDDTRGTDTGAIYIYEEPITGWSNATELTKIVPDETNANLRFGSALQIKEDHIYVGAQGGSISGQNSSGTVYNYVRPESGWASAIDPILLTAGDARQGAGFGYDLDVSGDHMVVGATFDSEGGTQAGAGYFFENQINRAPSFVIGANQSGLEDEGQQVVSGWATSISDGNDENQSLSFQVSNDNNALFSEQPHVSSTGQLTYTSASNQFGMANVTVALSDDGGTEHGGEDTSAEQLFTITIESVNDAPSFSLSEDQLSVMTNSGESEVANWVLTISDGDEGSQALSFDVSNDNNSLFAVQPVINTDGQLTFTAATDAVGSAQVTVQLSDNGGTANGGVNISEAQQFTIFIDDLNEAPSFVKGENQETLEDAGYQSVDNWATSISDGDEETQSLSFQVSNDNNDLFTVQPSLSSEGTLTYQAAANAVGQANLSVVLYDDGGTDNGGDNSSDEQTFTITIQGVNDAPQFTVGEDIVDLEGSENRTYSSWVENISDGDENTQQLNFTLINNNPSFFFIEPHIDPDGTLSFTPIEDSHGDVLVTVSLSDDGGTENGGLDTSDEQTFTISILPVNNAPSFMRGENITVLEDAGLQQFDGWATQISDGDDGLQDLTFQVSNDNQTLFSINPEISPEGQLIFEPMANSNGLAIITVLLEDNGGTENGGINVSDAITFEINVTGVNDAPDFELIGDVELLEDSSPYSQVDFAYQITDGDDDDQELTFILEIENSDLFAIPPTVSRNGTLEFVLADNAYGSTEVSVSLFDDGTTDHGGVNASEERFFNIEVNPVNDRPSFVIGDSQSIPEDSELQLIEGWATDITDGDSGDQLISFFTFNDNEALFDIQPLVSENGDLIYKPAENAFGSAQVEVYLTDSGGNLDGGLDRSQTETFTISIQSVNDEPIISEINDQRMDIGQPSIELFFTISDEDHLLEELDISAISEDEDIVSKSDMTLVREEDHFLLSIEPESGQLGNTLITIVVSDGQSVVSSEFDLFVNNVLSVPKLMQAEARIYPNPVQERLSIELADVTEPIQVVILTLSGHVVMTHHMPEFLSKKVIDVSKLPNGFYLLDIQSSSGNTLKKFIKN